MLSDASTSTDLHAFSFHRCLLLTLRNFVRTLHTEIHMLVMFCAVLSSITFPTALTFEYKDASSLDQFVIGRFGTFHIFSISIHSFPLLSENIGRTAVLFFSKKESEQVCPLSHPNTDERKSRRRHSTMACLMGPSCSSPPWAVYGLPCEIQPFES